MNNRPAGGKTPYEIRLDLLFLAKDILMAKHSAAAAVNASNQDNFLIMSSPTSEDIIAQAEILNTFVSKTNPTQHN